MTDGKTWKPNVTVAAICQRDNHFLLVKEVIDGAEVYNQPAGHLEPGESLEQAVIRETLEETSYQFIPKAIVGIYRFLPREDISNRTFLRIAFSGEVDQYLNQPLDREIIGTQWMTLDEIKNSRQKHRSPMVLQCILDYLNKPSYPLEILSRQFL